MNMRKPAWLNARSRKNGKQNKPHNPESTRPEKMMIIQQVLVGTPCHCPLEILAGSINKMRCPKNRIIQFIRARGVGGGRRVLCNYIKLSNNIVRKP